MEEVALTHVVLMALRLLLRDKSFKYVYIGDKNYVRCAHSQQCTSNMANIRHVAILVLY